MVGWIIIGVIAAIIVLIMLIPVGADLGYEDGRLHLSAKIDGMSLQLFPKKPVDESVPKKEKKPKKEKPPEKPKADKPRKNPLASFNRDELLSLVKKVLKSLGRFGKMFKVDRFLLHYTAAGHDPYNTAMTFAYVNAALSGLAPLCSQRFTVKDCSVRTDVDFTADWMSLDFGVTATVRIGQIFGMFNSILFGALGILIKNKLRLMAEKRRSKREVPAENGDNITATDEKNKNNLLTEERMESNG